jgi:hypothetical protein
MLNHTIKIITNFSSRIKKSFIKGKIPETELPVSMQCGHTHRITALTRLYTTNEHSEWHNRHTTCHVLSMKYHKILLHHIFPTKMYFLGTITTTASVTELLAVSTGKCLHDSPLQTQAHNYRDQSQNASTISWTHILQNPPCCSVRLCCFK